MMMMIYIESLLITYLSLTNNAEHMKKKIQPTKLKKNFLFFSCLCAGENMMMPDIVSFHHHHHHHENDDEKKGKKYMRIIFFVVENFCIHHILLSSKQFFSEKNKFSVTHTQFLIHRYLLFLINKF